MQKYELEVYAVFQWYERAVKNPRELYVDFNAVSFLCNDSKISFDGNRHI